MQVISDRLVAISRAVSNQFAEGKNYGTINADLGAPDDRPTAAPYEFLDGVVKSKP